MNESGDYLIIGAGPAGIQLGYFMEKSGKNYLILEQSNSGGNFFSTFPRHRKLLSINKIHTGYKDDEINLRWDWNSLLSDEPFLFKRYSSAYFPHADNLIQYLNDFVDNYKIHIKYNSKVKSISKNENGYIVIDTQGNQYFYRRIIIATGLSKTHIPQIEGIELAENYATFDPNPERYKNKRVLIIGKGNSAFETAESLIESAAHIHLTSPGKLTMAWESHFPGHLRAVNNNVIDTFQFKSQNVVLDLDEVKKIKRVGNEFYVSIYYGRDRVVDTRIFDAVIVCAGFQFDDSIFDSACKPELAINGRLPKQTAEWESTNIKDMFFAGTLMQMRDYKKTTSAFIHGFRYNIQILSKIFDFKYHNKKWDCFVLPYNAEKLTYAILERINRASSIWQQFGFICDYIEMLPDEKKLRYYNNIPVDYVHEVISNNGNYYTITLNYGTLPYNLPSSERDLNIVNPEHKDPFIHPVIRHFCGNKLVSELHIPGDLEGEWWDIDCYGKMLHEFLIKDMRLVSEMSFAIQNTQTQCFFKPQNDKVNIPSVHITENENRNRALPVSRAKL